MAAFSKAMKTEKRQPTVYPSLHKIILKCEQLMYKNLKKMTLAADTHKHNLSHLKGVGSLAQVGGDVLF